MLFFKRIIFIALLIFFSCSNAIAGRMTANMIGCFQKVDLFYLTKLNNKATASYVDSGNCQILYEGQQVNVIETGSFEGLRMSLISVTGLKLWVISDFIR
jgi:hypothetical protein